MRLSMTGRATPYDVLIDRLLQSPRFGERWGRRWLDVARYGESIRPSRIMPYPHAWRYRDYVIDAVNRDVPFDRFIQDSWQVTCFPPRRLRNGTAC